MLRCDFKVAQLQKLGNLSNENEDNILVPSNSEIESGIQIRFSVSDGATESSFSKEWSELLVNNYTDKSFSRNQINKTLKSISEIWSSLVSKIELPWYAQQKAETGAFATFLGLTIFPKRRSFKVVGVGDSNMFQVRKNNLHNSFPLSDVDDFDNTPNLIATNSKYQTDLDHNVFYAKGTIRKNDVFILATDALAKWFLEQVRKEKKPWEFLMNILDNHDQDYFENWLNTLRSNMEIKNDDVVVAIIRFE